MTDPAASAIALLVAQHEMTQANRPEPPKVTVTFSPNPTVKVKAKGLTKLEPSVQTARSMHTAGITPGTLDAKGFIQTVRKAVTREETIQAIQAYIGYDVRGDFGSQDQAARARAARELQPQRIAKGPSLAEQRSASRTVAGYVAGMPNVPARNAAADLAMAGHTAEEIQNLEKAMALMADGSRSKIAAGVELNRLRCLLSNLNK